VKNKEEEDEDEDDGAKEQRARGRGGPRSNDNKRTNDAAAERRRTRGTRGTRGERLRRQRRWRRRLELHGSLNTYAVPHTFLFLFFLSFAASFPSLLRCLLSLPRSAVTMELDPPYRQAHINTYLLGTSSPSLPLLLLMLLDVVIDRSIADSRALACADIMAIEALYSLGCLRSCPARLAALPILQPLRPLLEALEHLVSVISGRDLSSALALLTADRAENHGTALLAGIVARRPALLLPLHARHVRAARTHVFPRALAPLLTPLPCRYRVAGRPGAARTTARCRIDAASLGVSLVDRHAVG